MSTASPAIHTLSRRLLVSELEHVDSVTPGPLQAITVCEKLRAPLKTLAGTAAFASLLSRALTVAKRQAPALETLRVATDGTLQNTAEEELDSSELEQLRYAEVILVTELLSLLVTLIGEKLTLNLLRDAWPDVLTGIVTLTAEETL